MQRSFVAWNSGADLLRHNVGYCVAKDILCDMSLSTVISAHRASPLTSVAIMSFGLCGGFGCYLYQIPRRGYFYRFEGHEERKFFSGRIFSPFAGPFPTSAVGHPFFYFDYGESCGAARLGVILDRSVV